MHLKHSAGIHRHRPRRAFGYWVSSNPTDIQNTYLPNSVLERYASPVNCRLHAAGHDGDPTWSLYHASYVSSPVLQWLGVQN